MRNYEGRLGTPIERFFRKVKIAPVDQCWFWTGAFDESGYGLFAVRRRTFRAHRFIFQFAKGSIPKDKVLLHSCDEPACVNVHHLKIGTQKQNIADCIQKGRFWSQQ